MNVLCRNFLAEQARHKAKAVLRSNALAMEDERPAPREGEEAQVPSTSTYR